MSVRGYAAAQRCCHRVRPHQGQLMAAFASENASNTLPRYKKKLDACSLDNFELLLYFGLLIRFLSDFLCPRTQSHRPQHLKR